MLAELHGGAGLVVDEQVHLAYPADRGVPGPLVLGDAARLRTGSVIYAGSVIGDRFSTGHNVVIREECRIGDDVSVWSGTVIDYGCRIGDRVKIHSGCYVAQYTVIEDDAFLAPGVSFANDLYPGSLESAAYMRGPVIERGAQLGVNVTVLPYVRIGAGTIVGAGSVVVKDLPPGVIAVGSPAVPIRDVPDDRAVQGRVADAQSRVGSSR
jgi:acetyltransferase-like isoleucine patch superfamily enzyme